MSFYKRKSRREEYEYITIDFNTIPEKNPSPKQNKLIQELSNIQDGIFDEQYFTTLVKLVASGREDDVEREVLNIFKENDGKMTKRKLTSIIKKNIEKLAKTHLKI